MSTTVDQRVVEMQFDNSHFERNVATTMSTLEKLKQSLNLTGAAKGIESIGTAASKVNLSGLDGAVQAVHNQFSALEVMGVTALANITNSAINAGKRITKALTIDPIKTGFKEYETQINAVQTILANTESKGTTIDDVNVALDELNRYADMTIYNFTEMTRNIGTFTAAGVDLDKSVSAIKGIANLAAVSGSSSQQASTAMYQLSQALAAGRVSLMDWNSVVNAGMGGEVFQNALKRTAKAMGTDVDAIIKKYGSFRESLTRGEWLTTDVLTKTLEQFTMAAEEGSEQWETYKKSLMETGYTEAQALEILKMANTATDAATKVKTFTQLWDVLKEAAQSGWSQSWEIIVGDFEEAKALLTEVSNVLTDFINGMSDARNDLLQGWKDAGGRTKMIEAFGNAFQALLSVLKPIKDAFREVFPPTTVAQLTGMTDAVLEFSKKLTLSEGTAENLKNTAKGLFSVIKVGVDIFKAFLNVIPPIITVASALVKGLLSITGAIGGFVTGMSKTVDISKTVDSAVSNVSSSVESMGERVGNVLTNIGAAFNKFFSFVKNVGAGIKNAVAEAFGGFNINNVSGILGTGVFAMVGYHLHNILGTISDFAMEGKGLKLAIKEVFDTIGNSIQIWQGNIQANTLLKIAGAIGILAASVTVLAMVDTARLGGALTAMTLMFVELMGALTVFSGMMTQKGGLFGMAKVTSALLAMSSAMLILSFAMKNLGNLDWQDIGRGLLALTGMAAIMVKSTETISMVAPSMGKSAMSLIGLATSMLILSQTLKSISGLNLKEIGKGLVGIGALCAELYAFLTYTNFNGLSLKSSVGLIAIGTAVTILAKAVKELSSLNVKQLAKGTGAIAVLLGELTLFNKFNGASSGLLSTAASMVALSGAISIFAQSVALIGGMKGGDLAEAIITIGSALAMFTVALKAMTGTLAGSAALLVASVAIAALAPSLMLLGNIGWEGLAVSLITLAGAFTIIGVAGALLTPIIPSIVSLAGAMALFGLGILSTGAGLTAIGVGLTTLAAGFASIIQAAAPVVKGAVDLVLLFINTVLARLPEVVNAGMLLIISFLNGLSDALRTHSGELGLAIANIMTAILESAADIIISFGSVFKENGAEIAAKLVEGIGTLISSIIAMAGTLITSFINEIGLHASELLDVGKNIVTGLINGIRSGVGDFVKAARSLASSFIDTVQDVLDIHSPSREGEWLMMMTVRGLINGLRDGTVDLKNTTVSVMKNGVLIPVADIIDEVNKVNKEGVEAFESFMGEYAVLTSNLDSSKEINKTSRAMNEFCLQLYKETNQYKTDTETMKKHREELRELQNDRDSLHKQLEDHTAGRVKLTKDERKKVESELEKMESSIESKNEAIETHIVNMTENAQKAYDDLRESIKNSVASAVNPLTQNLDTGIDLFSEFSLNDEITPDTIIDNMKSQVSGVEDLMKNIGKLSGRGLSAGLIEELKNMGPSGASYVKAFTKMTNAELNTANRLFKQSSVLTAETFLSNFNNALVTAKERIADLQTLTTMGLNQGIVQALSEMGESSAGYIDAFLSMAPEQIEEFNAMYAESLTLPDSAANAMMQSFVTAGGSAANAFVNAINSTVGTDGETAVGMVEGATTLGANMTVGLQAGIDAEKDSTVDEAGTVADDVKDAFEDKLNYRNGKEIGTDITDGLEAGIRAGRSGVIDAAVDVAIAAYQAAKDALDINSPSGMFESLGEFSDLGMIRGLLNLSDKVKMAGAEVGTGALDGVRESISRIADIIDGNVDIQPVITPVLDLSNVESGIDWMNGVFAANRSLSLANGNYQTFSANGTSKIQSEQPVKGDTTIKFEQNIHSPKALSRIDIYRQTKNQFTAAKEVLSNR